MSNKNIHHHMIILDLCNNPLTRTHAIPFNCKYFAFDHQRTLASWESSAMMDWMPIRHPEASNNIFLLLRSVPVIFKARNRKRRLCVGALLLYALVSYTETGSLNYIDFTCTVL